MQLSYATYVPFEAPAALALKKISPKYLMAGCAFCWGLATLGMGKACFVHIGCELS